MGVLEWIFGRSLAESLAKYTSRSPDKARVRLCENALKRCGVKLTLIAVRLERLSKYYDRNFVGSELEGSHEAFAERTLPAALALCTGISDGHMQNYYAYSRDVDRALDMPET